MLKYTILFTTVFCMVQSQRPWHAGTGNRLPQVLPQYIDEQIAAGQAVQGAQATQGNQIIPDNQGIPMGQGVQGIPMGQGAQGIPVDQGIQGPRIGQGTQEPASTVFQGPQGITVCTVIPYQTNQGNPPGQGAQGTPTIGTGSTLLGNRIDGGNGGFTVATAPGTTINPADLPVDAHGDIDLVNRIKTWPRDKQPFWYINWQAIQAHRGDANNTAQPAQTQPNSRPFFAG